MGRRLREQGEPRRPARLADVAAAAGVGTSIVSRVLNRDPTVSIRPETRDRIIEAARELNYRPNAFARGLKLARTMTLGLVVNLEYPENLELLRAVERRATECGYVTVICDAGEFVELGDSYSRLLYEGRVDGLLVASALVSDDLVRTLIAASLPLVLVNRRLQGVANSVSVEDASAGRLSVEHLHGLGHSQIAHIAGPPYADIASRRRDGFLDGLEEAGLEAKEHWIVAADLEADSGFRAMNGLLDADDRFTAVVIWSPTTALGALSAAKGRGYSVPEDISVVCLHDAPLASYSDPPLSVVRLPLADMAKRAVDDLLHVIDGRGMSAAVVGTPPALIERGSTAAPRSRRS